MIIVCLLLFSFCSFNFSSNVTHISSALINPFNEGNINVLWVMPHASCNFNLLNTLTLYKYMVKNSQHHIGGFVS